MSLGKDIKMFVLKKRSKGTSKFSKWSVAKLPALHFNPVWWQIRGIVADVIKTNRHKH